MARLPQPGADQGQWGAILNEFLSQSHNTDGTVKDSSIPAAAFIDDSIVESKLSTAVQSKLNAVASGGVVSVNGRAGVVTLTKTDVSLVNVDNTSDASKPISSATQTALNTKEPTITAGTTAQYYRGDKTWQTLPSSAVTSVNTQTGVVVLAKADVGLSNVDNTSDITKNAATVTLTNKTISGASNTISNISQSSVTNLTTDLAAKAADTVVVHTTGTETVAGIKTFSSSPIVPTPTTGTQAANKTYVDGVVAGSAADATTSSKGIIQLAGDLSGTATSPTVSKVSGIAVSGTPTTGDVLTASSGSAATWTAPSGGGGSVTSVAGRTGVVTLTKADVSLANVDNTSDANKPVSTATQTALNLKEAAVTATTSSDYYRGDKTFQPLNKTAVGLSNIDNTSDANKPISTATQTALNAKADSTAIGAKLLLINNAAALPAGTPAGVVVVVKA